MLEKLKFGATDFEVQQHQKKIARIVKLWNGRGVDVVIGSTTYYSNSKVSTVAKDTLSSLPSSENHKQQSKLPEGTKKI